MSSMLKCCNLGDFIAVHVLTWPARRYSISSPSFLVVLSCISLPLHCFGYSCHSRVPWINRGRTVSASLLPDESSGNCISMMSVCLQTQARPSSCREARRNFGPFVLSLWRTSVGCSITHTHATDDTRRVTCTSRSVIARLPLPVSLQQCASRAAWQWWIRP